MFPLFDYPNMLCLAALKKLLEVIQGALELVYLFSWSGSFFEDPL